MPKQLRFSLDGEESAFEITKIDRSRLYGYKETEVLDENGLRCEFAVLADDGSTVVGGGDVGMGFLTVDGRWASRKELTPVNIEGDEIQPVGSSFDRVTELGQVVDADEFLTHDIRLVYALNAAALSGKLRDRLQAGEIFKFPYSYRGGLTADCGFLLQGADGNLFLLVGEAFAIEFIGLRESAVPLDDSAVDDDDFMSFDMI